MKKAIQVYLIISFIIASYGIIWDDTKMKTTTEDFIMTSLMWGPLLVVAMKDGTFKTFNGKQEENYNDKINKEKY